MDAQSPSKRFIRGLMSKSNAMQEIKSKLQNDPIRLEEMSAKSKQSNIKIVEGGKKDQSAAGSSKKRKEKITNYTDENAKGKEVVVSGLLEHDEAVKFLGKREPTRIPHMQCYTNIEVMKVLATKLTSSQYKEFCGTTCFAQLSSIRRCHVQAQLIRYIDYPWGKKAFDLLILHLHTKIKHDGIKVSHHIPRILNWKTKKDFPRLSYFAKGMFRDDNNPLVFKNLTPTPMELKILELPPEYVQSDPSPTETTAANASDDDFQDPPCPINNKGKEKVDTCLSPPKKSRQTITPIQNKTTPRVISKQPCLRKSPRRANVAKRPKSPLPKRQTKKHANVPSYTGIKQNVEIKSSVAFFNLILNFQINHICINTELHCNNIIQLLIR
ncbi:hypothetical protein KY285_015077 [Solanum tuberosum]|nr:hypothetical protein KY285_015077 [Solanum tuberosum]